MMFEEEDGMANIKIEALKLADGAVCYAQLKCQQALQSQYGHPLADRLTVPPIDWQKVMYDQMMQSIALLLQRSANAANEIALLRAELAAINVKTEPNLVVSCTERGEPVNFDRMWSKSMARY
jgi:hypothetical protein